MGIQQLLLERIHQGDRSGASSLIDAWASEFGYEHLFSRVLDPTLMMIGEEWSSSESFTLAEMYVAAKVTEDVMEKIARSRGDGWNDPSKGPVVIGNIEEDFHSLGRRLVGTFLRAEGWIVHDLGNDVPGAEFVDKAEQTGARVIGVSAMIMTTARNIEKVREEIERRGLSGRIRLAAGGAVFRVCPGLAEDVGADGTAPTALGAPALVERLCGESLKRETRS